MTPLSRRRVLKGSLRVAGVAVLAGLGFGFGHALSWRSRRRYPLKPARYSEAGVRLIRLPGSVQDDGDFLASCIRCYRCQDACPCGAVQFFGDRSDAHYHTPYIDPSEKGCDMCMKCTDACPTDAITSLRPEDRFEVRMATVELREDLCLSYKAKRIRDEQSMMMELGRSPTEATALTERRGPCGECFMFCPVRGRAITLEPGAFLAPILHEDQCTGCGMCEEICREIVRGEPAIRVVPTRGRVRA